jgi:cytochrome c oxidase subunit 1
MYFVLAGIVVFLFGGLTGPPNATVSTDLHLRHLYIVGHFHETMFGGYSFHSSHSHLLLVPKMTGRHMNEKLGKLHLAVCTYHFSYYRS